MELQNRSEKGSIFVMVIASVAIASMIAVSCLVFMNDHRERAGRKTDEALKQIQLEQTVLSIKRHIQQQAKTRGQIDLLDVRSEVAALEPAQRPPDSLRLTLNGRENGQEMLDPISDGSNSLDAMRESGDPFFGAKARILNVGVEASGVTQPASQSRLSSKRVTMTPEIDVREIPVSQFTVLAVGASLNVDPANFGGQTGRIYALGNVNITGNLSTAYPIVSGGNIQTAGMLTVHRDSMDSFSIQLGENEIAYAKPTDAAEGVWLAEARTHYDSAVVNPGTLPVGLDLVQSRNVERTSAPKSQPESAALDLNSIQIRCDLELVAQADGPGKYALVVVRGDPSWLVPDVRSATSTATVRPNPNGLVNADEFPNEITHQDDPFMVKNTNVGGHSEQPVIAFNYGALTAQTRQRLHSIYLGFNGSVPNAAILIRGAQGLQEALSIVSPHPVLVAGDFNSGRNPPPASIVTTQTVQAVDSSWGNQAFGAAP